MRDLDAWEMPLPGTTLIEASAGTGKTYTLTTLYLRLLVEEHLSPAQILVVTYTEAATAELRERVRERIQKAIEAPERPVANEEDEHLRALALRARAESASSGRPDVLRRALQAFDEAAIFTIHGFCQRTLQENAFESGLAFDAELVEKPDLLERTLAHDLWARLLAGEDPVFVSWLLEGAGKRWQFNPEALHRDLLRSLGADEDMPILPSSDPIAAAEDPAAIRERAVGALCDWAKAWDDRGAIVAELLLGENDLNRNSYKKEKIEQVWLPELDRFARQIGERAGADSVAALRLPGCFANLTNEILEKRTKAKGQVIEDSCFGAFDAAHAAVSANDKAHEVRALGLRWRFVAAAIEQAGARREERHLLFFDDLLSELRGALRSGDGSPAGGQRLRELLRDRYRFALIDEFQDTDPVQYEIFNTVWHEGPARPPGRGLVLIGDPKQAIYSFRGADVFTYLAARADAGEAAYGLRTNWRSDPGLIESVNALFQMRTHAFQLEEIDFDPVRPRSGRPSSFHAPGRSEAGFRVLMAERERASEFIDEEVVPDKVMPVRFGRTVLMAAVARDLADLLDAGAEIEGRPVDPSDIAILCRRKSELQAARRALEALGIACIDRGDADVFESREAWEFVCVLQAMMRSGDPATLRGALSTGAHGWNARPLADLSEESFELAEISERFAEYGRLWSQAGFGRAFESWRRREGVTARLLAHDDGERRLTNWLHLAELLQRVASERNPSRASLVAWFERSIANEEARALVGSDASLLRLERDDHAVSLITLHRSKGLEFPIVYLPSLWEDASGHGPSVESARKGSSQNPPIRFHDEESGRRTLDLAEPATYEEHVDRSKREAFSEQLRLLYVGLTRAKYQCVVAWGAIGPPSVHTPLAWLLHGPECEAEGLDSKKAAASLRKWDDARWIAAWQDLAEQAGPGSIEVESASFEPRERWRAPIVDRKRLEFTPPKRILDRPMRTTSFSALVREGHRGGAAMTGPEITGRDLDANTRASLAGVRPADVMLGEPETAIPDLAANMHEFPRGAEAGTLLHEVLERVDFADYDEEQVRTLGLELLGRNGLDADHVDQVVHVVDSVARTPLRRAPKAYRLADVEPGQLRPEIEFTLVTKGLDSGSSFDPEALSELLKTADDGSPLLRYAERAGRMGFNTLRGFLRGFIDAVFFDGKRYYLADYKSNHLGDRQSDYRPEALVTPMIDHDYVLQYLLYSVALDRHLSRRLRNYDYDKHFGGAYYLFLRGFAEAHEPGCGVFFDRPARKIVRGASELMGLGSEDLA